MSISDSHIVTTFHRDRVPRIQITNDRMMLNANFLFNHAITSDFFMFLFSDNISPKRDVNIAVSLLIPPFEEKMRGVNVDYPF